MSVHHLLGPLFTDRYELTMASGYFKRRLMAPATFSLYPVEISPRLQQLQQEI